MMKNYVCLPIVFLLGMCPAIWGQCSCKSTNNSYTTLTAPPPYTGADYFNGISYNTYTKLTTATGNLYTLSISGCSNPNVYISITSGTANGPIVACGHPPVSFTATTTAYFIHYFENSNCGGTLGYSCGGRLTFALTSALSVELLSFTGKVSGHGNELKWSTATETNSAYFEIEATTDGAGFRTLGSVKAAGNSQERQDYRLMDFTSDQITYYRLKQVDLDGSDTYHPLILVDRGRNSGITISPNPVSQKLHIDVEVNMAGDYTFSFMNAVGVSLEKNALLMKGRNRVEMDISGELASGFYVMRIIDGNGIVINTEKFVKQ